MSIRRAGALTCLGIALLFSRICFATPLAASLLPQGAEAIERYSITAERTSLRAAVNAAMTLSGEVTDAPLNRYSDDELISYAHFFAVVSCYSGDGELAKSAARMLQSIAARRDTLSDKNKKALSLVEQELHSEAVRITVVGGKDDPRSQVLWGEAVRVTVPHMRREWWDRREGPLPYADAKYPILLEPAAFVCANKKCSVPLYTSQELRERIEELKG